jgi:hypothetical protein
LRQHTGSAPKKFNPVKSNTHMPENDTPEYPPQFASSDLSSLLGQINDFVGMPPPPPPPPPGPMELASAKGSSKSAKVTAPSGNSSDELGRKIAAGEFVLPVSIVGSQSQRGPYLPGLKDVLIAVTYLRLAEQITTPEHKSAAQKFAYDLMQTGNTALGAHVAKQRRAKKK